MSVKRFFKMAVIGLIVVLFSIPQMASACDKTTLEKYWHGKYGHHITLPTHFFKDFHWDLLAKAKVDECFYGLQDPRNRESFNASFPNDFTAGQVKACKKDGGKPKINQAYVWGMAKEGKNIWFGTIANTLCLVFNGFYGPLTPAPMLNDSWACEMNFRDVRPPRIFMYDTHTRKLKDMTASVLAIETDRDRLMRTSGLRSAGALRDVVFLGGIGSGGVTFFAFNSQTGAYLGSAQYSQYNNIRQWRVINNELYTGVGKSGGGEILRWTGSVSDPFKFEKVGELLGDPAYLVEHKGRIFASTWGGPADTGGTCLYMSSPLGSDKKLTGEDADSWSIVWKLSEYEVEPAAFQVGGALESFGSWLYWGTMHVPATGLVSFQAMYPGAEIGAAAFLGTYRPIVIFRGKDFDKTKRKVELLYGNSRLPKYNAEQGRWEIVPNKMGETPKYGLAGMNNFFNNYTWTMQKHNGKLFVGTMDWLYLGGVMAESLGIDIPDSIQAFARGRLDGADLRCFTSTESPAISVDLNGLGNYLNYGLRTMVSDDYLYIGTANPMNLESDSRKPDGGWELYRLYEKHHWWNK